MKSYSLCLFLLASLSLGAAAETYQANTKLPGVTSISEFAGRWEQKVPAEDGWQNRGWIEESFTPGGDDPASHHQVMSLPDGRKVINHRLLQAGSLMPISTRQTLEGFPDGAPKSVSFEFHERRVVKNTEAADGQVTTEEGLLSTSGWDGSIFGLALAALDLKPGDSHRIPSVMGSFLGAYWVDLTVSTADPVTLKDGTSKALLRVDVEWINLQDGAIYPGGPDESGGSYYLFEDPPPGVSPVYRYINNGADIVMDL